MKTPKEQEKYNNIKKNLEINILHKRFKNKKELNQFLRKFKIGNVEECSTDYTDILDHNFVAPINKTWGYVDIYYLFDNQQNIYVTEIAISED